MHSKLAALLTGALSLGLVTTASAADMAVKARPAPAVVYAWTGFYIGGAIGGRWDDPRWNTTCQSPTIFAVCNPFADRFVTNNPQTFRSSAFRGAIYGGYNWQVGPSWVWGVEGDFGWANNSKTNAGIPGLESPTVAGAPGLDSSRVKQTWDGSLRLRAGYLVAPSVLLYGTGGVAFTHVEASATCGTTFPVGWCAIGTNIGRTDTASSDRVGWTVGGGIEAMIMPNWLLRGEYRYADYGTFQFNGLRSPAGVITVDSFNSDIRLRTHTAMVGLAYKFGGPVVAKY
jgi:outer membrane immunogenic protein